MSGIMRQTPKVGLNIRRNVSSKTCPALSPTPVCMSTLPTRHVCANRKESGCHRTPPPLHRGGIWEKLHQKKHGMNLRWRWRREPLECGPEAAGSSQDIYIHCNPDVQFSFTAVPPGLRELPNSLSADAWYMAVELMDGGPEVAVLYTSLKDGLKKDIRFPPENWFWFLSFLLTLKHF